MTPLDQIFEIATGRGHVVLTKEQIALMGERAQLLFSSASVFVDTAPTVLISHSAWQALADTTRKDHAPLRLHFAKTLMTLIGLDDTMPKLAVRCAPLQLLPALLPAKLNITAPETMFEAVDSSLPFAKAIDRAFASYHNPAAQALAQSEGHFAEPMVAIQAMVKGQTIHMQSRDLQTGELGPVLQDGVKLETSDMTRLRNLVRKLDGLAGAHLDIIVARNDDGFQLISASRIPAELTAQLRAAMGRVEEGVWGIDNALRAVPADRLVRMLHPKIVAQNKEIALAEGLAVSPGAATGTIVFDADEATRRQARGEKVMLVCVETGPGDIEGMKASQGIVTSRGGMSSHAAVVARITGKPCVAGLRDLQIDLAKKTMKLGDKSFAQGDTLTIDGTDGLIFDGALTLAQPEISGDIGTILSWADEVRTMNVRANVETVEDFENARSFGAQGIGLARSEHMFFAAERMTALRHLILAQGDDDRKDALAGLIDYQRDDYAALFSAIGDQPITVRLFDPPLHEFLPKTREEIIETAKALGTDAPQLQERIERLQETNPMLGHRGCRLFINHPEILEMQVQAIIEGLIQAFEKTRTRTKLEIMVPFVTAATEIAFIRAQIDAQIAKCTDEIDTYAEIKIGTMIELPRAALRAAELARSVDFFSFGTNDLTQTVFGISRDDAPAFLSAYMRQSIYSSDPFVTIDREGVGELIKLAIERGRDANPDLVIGICGEHAGDPESIEFFNSLGVDYISCSPFAVPVARLAAAQAVLKPRG